MFYHDRQRNVLIYPSSLISDLNYESLKGSKEFIHAGRSYVAVPVTLSNLRGLYDNDVPTLSPTYDYDWPIKPGWHPRAHQKEMTDFMLLHPRGLNLSDMGTQKTLAALWAADWLMQRKPGWKAIIVAPLSTLEVVWGDAIFTNFLGRRTFAVLHGSRDKRQRELDRDVDFYIVNHDGPAVGASFRKRQLHLADFSLALHNREDIKIVIYDEATCLSDAQTNRSKVARALFSHRPYVWPMTATPAANRPTDAYGIAKFVNNAYGETFTSFKSRTMIRLTQFKWAVMKGAADKVAELLSPAIRFDIKECYDLPPCTVQQRHVEFSKEQQAAYTDLKRGLTTKLAGGQRIDAVNEAVLRLKLFQICCGAVYDGDHVAHHLDVQGRIKQVIELVDVSQRKMIVFTQFTSVVEMIRNELGRNEIPCAAITGIVSAKQRRDIFQEFQNGGDLRVIVADPRTMAHGLTLTTAKVIVWFGPIDDNEIYDQANHRIDRPGQEDPTTIVQLSSCPVEREAYKRLDERQSMQGLVLKIIEGR